MTEGGRVQGVVTPAGADGSRVLRVVLAEDHAVVREGLKYLVNAQPDMRVVGEAADGEAAWHAARRLEPDLLVLDVSMPVLGGAEATERVRRDCPRVGVVALTVHEEQHYLRRMLRAGASGYVLKRAAPADLVGALRAVADGKRYVDPAMLDGLVDDYRGGAADGAGPAPQAPLSDREREVLVHIARGLSNKEIAALLGISVKTVETYKARLAEKLGLRTRPEIVRYASRRGWLDG